MEKGKLSVHTENILPVIKKWLYSEKEIFLRELVSNGVDAITKLNKISLTEDIYQPEENDYRVEISIDREKKILSFEDNGIGLNAEEVRKYIAQIAFSGAEDFAKQIQESKDQSGIIGNFGLGFYSAFMVSAKVEVESRSYRKDDQAVLWIGDGSDEYSIDSSEKTKRGTIIRLHLHEEESEYLEKPRISELVRKYCDFLPVSVYVDGSQVNKKDPLWSRAPSSVKREEYIEFYRYLFPYQGDPLFYIHLNVDYPFRLQGILYFPRLAHEMDVNRSGVKIYCKQVFVTNEAQEIIPKFLTVLQGVLDMPDLPLNVSRSYVQNEPQVKKIATHIVKKVSDRLVSENKDHSQEFRKIWSEIAPFVKYGMMSDEKFYEQAKPALLFEVASSMTSNDNKDESDKDTFTTIEDYLVLNKDKCENRIFYTTDIRSQGGAIKLLQGQGIPVIKMDTMIDSHFITFLEYKSNEAKFIRVDAELAGSLVDENKSDLLDADAKSTKDKLVELFKSAIKNDKVTVRVEHLKSPEIPAMILLSEQSRRISEMSAMMDRGTVTFPEEHTFLVNLKSPLIQKLATETIVGADIKSSRTDSARQIYMLARLAQGGVGPEEIQKFVEESQKFIEGTL